MVDRPPSGSGLPEGLGYDRFEVDAGLRRRLGVRLVTAVWGPLLRHGDPLPPGQVTVEFRVPRTGLYGQLAYQAIDGRRQLVGVTRLANDRRPTLAISAVRSLPITEVERELDALLDWFRGEDHRAFQQSFEAFAAADIARPGRGRTLPEIDLVRAAVKYSRLRGQRDVYGTLAEQCHISRNYARNLVYEARKAGLLEPTTRGKPNFDLTDKALRLVGDHLSEPEQER